MANTFEPVFLYSSPSFFPSKIKVINFVISDQVSMDMEREVPNPIPSQCRYQISGARKHVFKKLDKTFLAVDMEQDETGK